MADRVHPHDSPPTNVHDETSSETSETSLKPTSHPGSDKPVPQPGTYVIHIPKDQVYRVPPPENARRYNDLTRRSKRRRPCCCCLCWSLGILTFLLVLIAVTAAIFYLVVKPEAPNYTVDSIAISGFNTSTSSSSSSSLTVSPEFDVAVRADNPNDKIGIDYQKDSSVEIYYTDVSLCNGVLPEFYQPSNNVTVFKTALKGSGVVLSSSVKNSLVAAQSQGRVPLLLKVRAPVKIKVGSVKTWTITVKVDCDITVDKLSANATILSKDCHYGVKLW